MRWSPQYHVACQIQKKVLAKMGIHFQEANRVPRSATEDCDLNPKDLAALIASWNTLEERKRILRMKGLPKAIEVKPAQKKGFNRASFEE